MAKTQEKVIIRNFAKPDEVRTFQKGKLELVKVNGALVGKGTFEPGWKWSLHVKPLAKTELCEAPHFQYVVSGQMAIRAADGEEHTMKAGDVVKMGSGHDAWVIGDEKVVVVDFQGMVDYAKPK
ncbi:MAG TPA: cupin domain-containing protein [Elusimicrobiota bacterium]|nr:cupin domain-containing protein [Elusimicrobiota bacterium]